MKEKPPFPSEKPKVQSTFTPVAVLANRGVNKTGVYRADDKRNQGLHPRPNGPR